jgi:tetratricopeptide (TPR) repeat protein
MLDHYLHTAYAADRLLNPTRDPITLPRLAPAITRQTWPTTNRPSTGSRPNIPCCSPSSTGGPPPDMTRRPGSSPGRSADSLPSRDIGTTGIGWCQAWLGDHRSALIACQEALTLFQKLGIRHAEADTWDSLGYIRYGLTHYSQAITCYRKALDLHRDRGNRNYEVATLSRLGDTHHATGDHRAAQTAWQQALAILHDLDHPDAEHVRAKLRDLRRTTGQIRG